MTNLLFVIGMFVSMAAIGVLVWRRLRSQEGADPKFRARLDADDERARRNRQSRTGS